MFQYHFEDYQNPTRYNLAKVFATIGAKRTINKDQAQFSDTNLSLSPVDSTHLEYKHKLHQLLSGQVGSALPESYIIDDHNWNQVLDEVMHKHHMDGNQFIDAPSETCWILKPSLLNNGDHIKLFSNMSAIWDHFSSFRRLGGIHVLQRYLTKPKLLAGCKHTFRVYVIITNYDGAWLYHHGYFNLSLKSYQAEFNDLSVHLTNEHLNGALSNVVQKPSQHYPDYHKFYTQFKDIITMVLGRLNEVVPILQRYRERKFDIFGFDFILDAQDKAWLLEVNHGPHFPTNQKHALSESIYADFWRAIVKSFCLPTVQHVRLKELSYHGFDRIINKPAWYYPIIRKFK